LVSFCHRCSRGGLPPNIPALARQTAEYAESAEEVLRFSASSPRSPRIPRLGCPDRKQAFCPEIAHRCSRRGLPSRRAGRTTAAAWPFAKSIAKELPERNSNARNSDGH